MKSATRIISLVLAIGSSALSVMGQTARSGYFLDDYTYRFQLNPALGLSHNFISMPALANVNVDMHGSLKVSDLLYNVNGKTTTFLNPAISAGDAMDKFSTDNHIGADIQLTLLAAGFKAMGGYNTIAINTRVNTAAFIPHSLFSFLKEGVANKTYSISHLGAFATAYAELTLGHSHQINNKWRVGATMKLIAGGGNIDANLNKARLELGENDWTITSNGDINANVRGFSYKTKTNDHTKHHYVNGAEINNTGINGFGLAFDLGATFRASKDVTLSAAILDLGFIRWNNNILASTGGDRTFNTNRYTFNVDDDQPNSFSNEWKNMRDDLSSLYELDDVGNTGARSHMLAATLNLGLQYTVPTYRPLSFGLLNTTRINGRYSWTDFRLSANIAPVKCFEASLNMSVGTFGVGLGWLLNLHTKGFNLFLGMDRTPWKLAKQFVPLNSNASVNVGMNFPF